MSILSADTDPPYNRPPLSKGFLRGELEADAVFVEPEAAYAETHSASASTVLWFLSILVSVRLGPGLPPTTTDPAGLMTGGAAPG